MFRGGFFQRFGPPVNVLSFMCYKFSSIRVLKLNFVRDVFGSSPFDLESVKLDL